MTAVQTVQEAIAGYKGDSLQCVLIGSDYWPDFLIETGLTPYETHGGDTEVTFRGIPCRCSATPDAINLVTGY